MKRSCAAKLAAIALLACVPILGCSPGEQYREDSQVNPPVVQAPPSFLGCWQATTAHPNLTTIDTHIFLPDNIYSGTRDSKGPLLQGVPGFVNYSGRWLKDGNYILFEDDKRGKIKLEIISDDILKHVGTSPPIIYTRCK